MNKIKITNAEAQPINITGGGEVLGITAVYVNDVDVTEGNAAYVTVPTKTSELQNDSGFITNETDPTVPAAVKNISQADINSWNNKQNLLVSGTTIKTINDTSLLGSGNINVGGTTYIAGTGISINNGEINNTITSYNDLTNLPTIPSKTSDLINDSEFVQSSELAEVAFNGSYNALSDTPVIPDATSDLTNDSNFAATNVNNNWSTSQTITGDITLSGNINYKKYSTNEVLIGKWIDNKDLYQKSFGVTLPNNLTGSVNTNLTTESVKNIYGSYTDEIRVYPINFHDQTSHNEINTSYENGYIKFETNFDGSNYTGYVTLEYTKD